LCLFAFGGCHLGQRGVIDSPWPVSRQQAELLKVVPLGTPRDQAEQFLQGAGIEYVRAPRNTVIHCTLWNRPNGERWHINVALLFDRNQELYAVRESDARVEPLTGSELAGHDGQGVEAEENRANPDEPRRAFASP